MFESWKKKRCLTKFLTSLPPQLVKRYGASEYYTKGQIERTLDEGGFGRAYCGYALTIFLTQEDAMDALRDTQLYASIRQEIADLFFSGDLNFKVNLSKGNSGHDSIGGGEAD